MRHTITATDPNSQQIQVLLRTTARRTQGNYQIHTAYIITIVHSHDIIMML